MGAAICFYEAIDLRFVTVILKEFIKGWAPTSDYRVALSGPLETFRFASLIERDPSSWIYLPALPMFDILTTQRMLKRAEHDWAFRHWEGVPILVWTILFAVIGIVRFRQRTLSLEALLIGLTVLGIGAVAYAATCIAVYSTPRYVLPLLVSVFAFGSIVFSNDPESQMSQGHPDGASAHPRVRRDGAK